MHNVIFSSFSKVERLETSPAKKRNDGCAEIKKQERGRAPDTSQRMPASQRTFESLLSENATVALLNMTKHGIPKDTFRTVRLGISRSFLICQRACLSRCCGQKFRQSLLAKQRSRLISPRCCPIILSVLQCV